MMMPRSLARPLLAVLLSSLPLAVAAVTAAPPSPSADTFSESIDVQVVNVDVYVTGRDGKSVEGLKREDFELREDGKPVALSNFYAVGAAVPPTVDLSSAEAPGTAAPAAVPTVPEAQRLYLALFLDERSLTLAARNRVLPSVKSFAAGKLRPGDRFLLATYNGVVKVVQPPTTDPVAISAALAGLAKGAARGTERSIDRRRVLDELDLGTLGSNSASDASTTYSAVRLLALADADEIRATVSAIRQFIDSLAGLPGRKAVLLVSGGMAAHPGEILYEAWQAKYGRFSAQVGASRLDAFRQDSNRSFQELVEHANANRVTFYTLAVPDDVSGLSAEHPGNNLLAPGLAEAEVLNETQPLQTLAGETGGLAAVDQAGSLLDRLRTDLDSYYSLGYVPSHPPDGKKHKLAVQLRDRAFTVRVRESYKARTGPEVTGSRTLSALLLGEGGNPLGVTLAVEGEKKSSKGQYEVSLLVQMPLAKLTLVPHGGDHEGRVRVFVGAQDAQGRLSDINEIVLPVHIPEARLSAQTSQNVGTRVTLLLRPGRHTLAVGVRDEIANTDSTLTGAYTAGRLTQEKKKP